MATTSIRLIRLIAASIAVILLAGVTARPVVAQQTGVVTGVMTRASDNEPLSGVSVAVVGTAIRGVTGADGRYTLRRIPVGQQTVRFRKLGYRPVQMTVSVMANATATADMALTFAPIQLGEIVVTTSSRVPERVVDAPAAVASIDRVTLRDASITGQAPLVLNNVPGIDVVQSGMNDFNVNSRGFNSSLNRRVLVLQDGRDVAIGFLGSQEWSTSSLPTEDLDRVEFVRGPGSALYGANAYAGVLALSTPTAREVTGTKLTLAGGELNTFRSDLRHAGVFSGGQFGYRVNAGYGRSDTWTRSLTLVDSTSLRKEYMEATDSLVPLRSGEVRPLNGQTLDATGQALGDREALEQFYGSVRFDYYAPDGSILSIDGGGAAALNGVVVTGIGRVQIINSLRPWARAAWAADNYNLMAWYSGRNSIKPQFSLSSGLGLETKSDIFHVEGQYNRSFVDDKGKVVIGASFRSAHIDTRDSVGASTLMAAVNDDRTDKFYAGYAQLEYRITPQLKVVGAARVDDGDLYDLQFSPKAAVVLSPNEDHSVRFTFNHAFQTPNYSEFFLQVPAAAPSTNPAALEGGLEGFFAQVQDPATVGPALAAAMQTLGLPADLPWNFAAETPVLALGYPDLVVETVNSFEVGYKGSLSDRVYVTADGYYSELENFVTDLLAACLINVSSAPCYSLTDGGTDIPANLAAIEAVLVGAGLPASHPLRIGLGQLRTGYTGLLAQAGPLLATVGGGRVLALSYANAGEVTETGVELGIGAYLTDEVRVDGSYTFFDFDIDVASPDELVPNTPKHKATLGLSYSGRQGFEASASGRWVDGYQWAAGVFEGWIPSSLTINASAGYAINNYVRAHATVTNLLDQQRFHIFGGSVIGRRVIGGITASF